MSEMETILPQSILGTWLKTAGGPCLANKITISAASVKLDISFMVLFIHVDVLLDMYVNKLESNFYLFTQYIPDNAF